MPRQKKSIKQFRYADNHPDYSRVIRDSRNGYEDVFIPTKLARELYEAGKLSIDETNSEGKGKTVYCPPFKGFDQGLFPQREHWSHPEMKRWNQLIEVS